MELILINEKHEFWDGYNWVAEYPDAARYPAVPRGEELKRILNKQTGNIEVVKDYGLITERAVLVFSFNK